MSPLVALTRKQVEGVSLYSARRVLPTVADLAKFSVDDRVKLGGGRAAEVRDASNRARTPNIYSDAWFFVNLHVKSSVLGVVSNERVE